MADFDLWQLAANETLKTIKKFTENLDVVQIFASKSLSSMRILPESAYNPDIDVFLYFIHQGADLDIYIDKVINNAIFSGNIEILMYIYRCEKKINPQYIILAIERGDEDVINFLCNIVGIDIQPYTYECLAGAIEQNHIYLTKKLFHTFKFILPSDKGQQLSLFLLAIQESNFEIAEYLIWKGIPDKYLNSRRINTLIKNKYDRYISIKTRAEYRASKKIYFWWVQVCYDVKRPCGNRMMRRNYEEYHKIVF